MEYALRALAIFRLINLALRTVRDHGFQSVMKTVLSEIDNRVKSGFLSDEHAEAMKEIVEDVVRAHPEVRNPLPANALQAPTATDASGGPMYTADQVAAMIAQVNAGKKRSPAKKGATKK